MYQGWTLAATPVSFQFPVYCAPPDLFRAFCQWNVKEQSGAFVAAEANSANATT
jgi:hypothetical protein